MLLRNHFSFRTQVLFVFILCLSLLAMGMVFLNTYVIAGLKEGMRAHAILLAEEQAQNAVDEIRQTLEAPGAGSGLLEAGQSPGLSRQIEIVLRGNKNLMAVCVLDTEGNLVLSETGNAGKQVQLKKDAEGMEASFASEDFNSVQVRLRRQNPGLQTVKVPITRNSKVLGDMVFLISESSIYRDIASAAGEITRRLWSVLLAFFSVLLLGLYLMARLFRNRLRLLERTEQLDRMAYVGSLASGLAHEIRNPLNAMSVNLSVAQEELGAGDPGSGELVGRLLREIQRSVERVSHSVTSFMEFAHPHAYRRERMELQPVVGAVLELLAPQIAESGVRVEVALPPSAELEADFSGLRQVLYNVVLNALQAMNGMEDPERERRLEIGGRRESAQWFLWVEDTGPGIPPGEEGRIFEVFHSTKAAGSGFGLSIARAIIQAHGGGMAARRSAGGGLRVEITLPETGRHWKRMDREDRHE